MVNPKVRWWLLLVVALAVLAPVGLATAQDEPPLLPSAIPVTPINPAPDQAPAPNEPPSPTPGVPQATAMPTSARSVGHTDTCEPNDTPATACLLSLDAISGPFTIVPAADQDFYAIELPTDPALQTVVTLRASAGLDLRLTAQQTSTVLASGTLSVTIPPTISGRVIVQVAEHGVADTASERYRIDVQRELVPVVSQPTNTGDALENNWSPATAHPIAVGVVYDLSLRCPETRPDACPGGDHDYLLVPLKGGVPYLLVTFDLAPGVDTVIELFWAEAATPTIGNDDYAPGGLLSGVTFTPPTDGLAIVRIAPRNGGLVERATPDGAATYRFAIAPLASELATKLTELLQQQAHVPTPTATVRPPPPSSPGSAPAAPPAPGGAAPPAPTRAPSGRSGLQPTSAVKESIERGPAIIMRATDLRREPRPDADLVAQLAVEQVVELRGPVIGMWVSVDSPTSLLPGWVWGTDLQRLLPEVVATMTALPPTAATNAPPSTGSPTAGMSGTATARPPRTAVPTPTPTPIVVQVQPLDPALPPPVPTALPRVAVALLVEVIAGPPPSDPPFGGPTPTPDRQQPLVGIHVQLVDAFGAVLAEARTDGQGQVRLSRDVAPTDALWVQLPAWGIAVPVEPAQSTLLIHMPEDAQ
jgi:hypothetical protein